MSEGSKAARGGFITIAGQAVRFAVQFGSTIVLARLLDPAAFGLVVMTTAIVGIGEVLRDFGLSAAAMTSKNITHQQRSNLFWTNTGIGVALSIVVYLLAEPIAGFYRDDRLVDITVLIAVTFFFNGLQTQYQAELATSGLFKRLTVTELVASTFSWVLAIVLALMGYGYWALVWQLVSFPVVRAALRIAVTPWRPSLPRRGADMKGLYTFGLSLASAQLLVYLSNNIDRIILGRLTSVSVVGLYNQAFRLVMTPNTQALPPLNQVVLPTLSRADDRNFSRYTSLAQLLVGYPLVMVFSVVVATGESIIVLFFGEPWREAGVFFRILAVAAAFQAMTFVAHWVFLAVRKPASNLRYALVVRTFIIAAVSFGAFSAGGVGAAVAYSVSTVLAWPFSVWWISRIAPVNRREMLGQGTRIALTGCSAGLCAWAVNAALGWDGLLSIAVAVLLALGVFLTALHVLPAWRADRDGLYRTARSLRRKMETAAV